MQIWRTKPVEQSMADIDSGEQKLRRAFGPVSLTLWGVGVVIGTGIFVLTGVAAATRSGPAVSLSFLVAGVACALAALCYAEFAAAVPVSGSAYTFSYATVGELLAWIIGWDLVLEFALGAATVAVGWSGYFASLLDSAGIALPDSLSGPDAVWNLPASLIVLAVSGILIAGIRASARVNAIIVGVKIAIVLLVIFLGLTYVEPHNWEPFIPASDQPVDATGLEHTPLLQALLGQETSRFGVGGIFTGAALVFFAYIGFDVVATAAEETRRPQRNLPIGIIGSLAICTVLYVAVSLVVTGMVPYSTLDVADPLAFAFKSHGVDWAATVISVGALAGLTTVMMVMMYGQSRVAFAMSRDRLLSPSLGQVHPRWRTPYRISAITGVSVAALSGFVSLDTLADLSNIGTLFAFVLVSIAVLVLRRKRPDLPRPFRVPFAPVVAVLAVAACLYLMLNLVVATWLRFAAWMAIGLVVYACYGYRKSRLGTTETPPPSGAAAGQEEESATEDDVDERTVV